VVIGAELDMENPGSIRRNCDQEGAETTWYQNWPPNQIQLVVKTKKNKKWLHEYIELLKSNKGHIVVRDPIVNSFF
jgi:phage terminase large subunit-like protein